MSPGTREITARGRSLWSAAVLVLATVGCGASGPSPTIPPGHGSAAAAPQADDACRPAYAEYEQRWRIALTEDLLEISEAMEPAEIEDIVAGQLTTLPNHDELAKLRTLYAVVELFLIEAPWPAAFAAADRAIERCGEGAARPVATEHIGSTAPPAS